jgi:hypothetical protein
MSAPPKREERRKKAPVNSGEAVTERELGQSWKQSIQLLFSRMKALQAGSGGRSLLQGVTDNIEQAIVLADALSYSESYDRLLGILDDWKALASGGQKLNQELLGKLAEQVGKLTVGERETRPKREAPSPVASTEDKVPKPSVSADGVKETRLQRTVSASAAPVQDDLLDRAEPLDFPEERISVESSILEGDEGTGKAVAGGESQPKATADLKVGKGISRSEALTAQKLTDIESALTSLSADCRKLQEWLLLLPELGTRLGREREHTQGLSEMVLGILSRMEELAESGSSILVREDSALEKETGDLLAKLALEVSAASGELEKLDDLAWGLLGAIEDDAKRIGESVSLLKKLILPARGR